MGKKKASKVFEETLSSRSNSMKISILCLCLGVLNFAAFSQTMPADADPKIWAAALKIHKKAIVIDGHNDITGPMVDMDFDLSQDSTGKTQTGGDPIHTDIARWKKGGMTGQFMSIYVSGSTLTSGGAMRRAMDLIDVTNREAEKHEDLVSCTTAAEIRRAKKQNIICLLMGIEGGYAIENSLYALRNFYRLGIRYMTLTHNVAHDWADAHRDIKHNGLTDFGKEVVREMNRLGMLVDISHVSEKVMSDVLDISKAPLIASHSGARGVNDHTRNVPDAILKRLPQNGGVIMVVFYPSFLDERTNREENERTAKLRDQVAKLRLQTHRRSHRPHKARRRNRSRRARFGLRRRSVSAHPDERRRRPRPRNLRNAPPRLHRTGDTQGPRRKLPPCLRPS